MKVSSSHTVGHQLLQVALICSVMQLSNLNTSAQHETRQLERDQTTANIADARRLALVIGNGAYTGIPPLKNPPNDSALVAATLTKLGFNVSVGTNKSQREMKQLIRNFGQELRNARSVGLFYFAGHGVQSKGRNYVIPIDADIQTEADLEDAAVDINYVLSTMEEAQNPLNIVILDACRNNPFPQMLRSAQRGLAQIRAPTGTFIAYATAPDSAAADGTGLNSPYTEELVRQLQRPGVLIETTFRRVTEEVSSRTGGKQEPWYSANIKGEFYFNQSSTPEVNANTSNSASKVVEPDPRERLQRPAPDGKKIQVRVKPFAIDLLSCRSSAGDVTCEFTLTNMSGIDREFRLCTKDHRIRRRNLDVTKATDSSGSQYEVSESILGSNRTKAGYVTTALLPPNTPIRLALIFPNVPESSSTFVLLRISMYESVNSVVLLPYADFRNVEIEK